MKYDLIVVGGGPGGLMAAKTAAADGLKVLCLERKRNITEIHRACSQIFYVRKLSPSGKSDTGTGKTKSDGYIDPVGVEMQQEKTVFHFYTPGFKLDYRGVLRPYLNWMHISPGGHIVNRYKVNDRPWGFYYHKEVFLAGLLEEATKAGAEVRAETMVAAAENIPGRPQGGVRVKIRTKSGEEALEGRAVIAADGRQSTVVETVGLNRDRKALAAAPRVFLQYIMEGIETGYPDCSYLTWLIPSLNPMGFIAIGQSEESRHKLATLTGRDRSPDEVLQKFLQYPTVAHMFRKARIVTKETVSYSGGTMMPIREPVMGNVVVVGDAGAPAETWIQGAVACGYQAVKAIEKELNGQKGYPDYIAWWQQAFAFNTPDYLKMVANLYPLPQLCSDEEIDYVYRMFEGDIGIPQLLVGTRLDRIKAERPELHARLTKGRL